MNLNATILGQGIAFFLFVFFCMKYVWPPIITVIEERQKAISDSLESIKDAKKKTRLAAVDAANHLTSAREQAKELIQQANKYKLKILNDAKFEAEQERKRILVQTQVEVKEEYQRANEALCKQIAILVIASTEKIIGQSIDEKINDDIIDKLIAEI